MQFRLKNVFATYWRKTVSITFVIARLTSGQILGPEKILVLNIPQKSDLPMSRFGRMLIFPCHTVDANDGRTLWRRTDPAAAVAQIHHVRARKHSSQAPPNPAGEDRQVVRRYASRIDGQFVITDNVCVFNINPL